MIDAIDADMHARAGDAELTPWLLLLDCAPQHVAAEFRSIVRDSRPHIKLCYVQRNFTGYTQPLDRAYMRPLQELDPPRGSRTLRRVLLGSRGQLRTCQSGLRAHSSTERRQSATSNRWLTLHRELRPRGRAARRRDGYQSRLGGKCPQERMISSSASVSPSRHSGPAPPPFPPARCAPSWF